MNTKKIIIGGIAGGVAYFFLGWLVYGILLADFMKANYNMCAARPEQDMIWWAMIVSNLAWGFLLAIIFSMTKANSIMHAVKTALIFGILIAISMDLSFYSMSTTFLNFKAVIFDLIIFSIMSCLIGLIVALTMGLGKKVD